MVIPICFQCHIPVKQQRIRQKHGITKLRGRRCPGPRVVVSDHARGVEARRRSRRCRGREDGAGPRGGGRARGEVVGVARRRDHDGGEAARGEVRRPRRLGGRARLRLRRRYRRSRRGGGGGLGGSRGRGVGGEEPHLTDLGLHAARRRARRPAEIHRPRRGGRERARVWMGGVSGLARVSGKRAQGDDELASGRARGWGIGRVGGSARVSDVVNQV